MTLDSVVTSITNSMVVPSSPETLHEEEDYNDMDIISLIEYSCCLIANDFDETKISFDHPAPLPNDISIDWVTNCIYANFLYDIAYYFDTYYYQYPEYLSIYGKIHQFIKQHTKLYHMEVNKDRNSVKQYIRKIADPLKFHAFMTMIATEIKNDFDFCDLLTMNYHELMGDTSNLDDLMKTNPVFIIKTYYTRKLNDLFAERDRAIAKYRLIQTKFNHKPKRRQRCRECLSIYEKHMHELKYGDIDEDFVVRKRNDTETSRIKRKIEALIHMCNETQENIMKYDKMLKEYQNIMKEAIRLMNQDKCNRKRLYLK